MRPFAHFFSFFELDIFEDRRVFRPPSIPPRGRAPVICRTVCFGMMNRYRVFSLSFERWRLFLSRQKKRDFFCDSFRNYDDCLEALISCVVSR